MNESEHVCIVASSTLDILIHCVLLSLFVVFLTLGSRVGSGLSNVARQFFPLWIHSYRRSCLGVLTGARSRL